MPILTTLGYVVVILEPSNREKTAIFVSKIY